MDDSVSKCVTVMYDGKKEKGFIRNCTNLKRILSFVIFEAVLSHNLKIVKLYSSPRIIDREYSYRNKIESTLSYTNYISL